MKTLITYEEIESLGEMLIKDFMETFHKADECSVDIETFVTEYLNVPIWYEEFADKETQRWGFFSDGLHELKIVRDNKEVLSLFPKDSIVINRCLCKPEESGKRRFTIAHEGAHFVLEKHGSVFSSAAFHSEFNTDANYSREKLKELMSVNESMANRAAACFLMPRFLIEKALKKYNSGNRIVAYDGMIFTMDQKLLIQHVAATLGVNYSPLIMRLRELKLLDVRPAEEYIQAVFRSGGLA